MCCEEPSPDLLPRTTSESSALGLEAFYAGLHAGLHAMAQPITLLRSYFYVARSAGAFHSQTEPIIGDAESGIEQLCTVFRLMQELVRAQTEEACIEPVTFSAIAVSLREDAEAVFAGSGLRLAIGPAEPEEQSAPMVHTMLAIDSGRTRQALLSTLAAVRQSVTPGSEIGCALRVDRQWAEVRFAPENRPEAKAFDELSHLHLGLAKANLVGQGAGLSSETWPFSLSMRLPVRNGQG